MLESPDARRGLRSVIAAIVTLTLVALVYWTVELLAKSPDHLLTIAEGCLLIVALGMLGYIAENGIRAIKIEGPGGMRADLETDAPAAAQSVAVAAKSAADAISDEATP